MIERYFPYVLALIVPTIFFYYKVSPKEISNFKDILNSTISMGSIAVGFLAAAITLLPSLSSNKFVSKLKQMGAYVKLLRYLISAIISLFLTSLLSVIGLFVNVDTVTWTDRIFLILWSFLFSLSIFTTFRVIRNFLVFLIISQNEDE